MRDDVGRIVWIFCNLYGGDKVTSLNPARYMTDFLSDAWNLATYFIDYAFGNVDLEGGVYDTSNRIHCDVPGTSSDC